MNFNILTIRDIELGDRVYIASHTTGVGTYSVHLILKSIDYKEDEAVYEIYGNPLADQVRLPLGYPLFKGGEEAVNYYEWKIKERDDAERARIKAEKEMRS